MYFADRRSLFKKYLTFCKNVHYHNNSVVVTPLKTDQLLYCTVQDVRTVSLGLPQQILFGDSQ